MFTLCILAALAACGPGTREQDSRTVQPGAPGEPSRQVDPGSIQAGEQGYTEADVAFMQAMLSHHAQALAMTALVPRRTDRRDIRLAAERIEHSQSTEIAFMRRWLESRNEEAPRPHGGAHGAGVPMDEAHGMASPEEMAALAASRGEEFDRLFLELMIRHHEGALRMARELLATEGAAEEPELFQFVSHVDADQRAEIARLRRMLNDSIQ